MAWIAALISAVGGAASASQQKKSAKKSSLNQTGIINSTTQRAISGLDPYSNLGGVAAGGLGELMGLQGYRTSEEKALTEHLSNAPLYKGQKVDPSKFDASGFRGFLDKQEKYSTMGDTLGGVTSYFNKRNRKKAAKLASAQQQADAAAKAQYAEEMAAWEAKKAELENSANQSLRNYDPMAVLMKTPGYQARLEQGERAVSARQVGRQLSGRAAKELARYGQEYASNEYNNEFARRLSLAGIGQNAQNAVGNWSVGQGTTLATIAGNKAAADADYSSSMNNVLQSGLQNYLTYKSRNSGESTPYSSSYSGTELPKASLPEGSYFG